MARTRSAKLEQATAVDDTTPARRAHHAQRYMRCKHTKRLNRFFKRQTRGATRIAQGAAEENKTKIQAEYEAAQRAAKEYSSQEDPTEWGDTDDDQEAYRLRLAQKKRRDEERESSEEEELEGEVGDEGTEKTFSPSCNIWRLKESPDYGPETELEQEARDEEEIRTERGKKNGGQGKPTRCHTV